MEQIIAAVDSGVLLEELASSQLLGMTTDKKEIYLVSQPNADNLLTEIGRLRELTFRVIGAGTGKSVDLDKYDQFYKHIVVWDSENTEIVGSYRLGYCPEILELRDVNSLYTSELFSFNPSFVELISNGIEVGRSFVQEKYWNSNALDYLWQGIGCFLKFYPVRYLFGGVGINGSYTERDRAMIIHYYSKWFASTENHAVSKHPFLISQSQFQELQEFFNTNSINEDFKTLKTVLRKEGLSIPVLLRKYTDICHYGGVEFIDFCNDPDFKKSTVCLISVDLEYLKDEFKERYMGKKSLIAK